MAVTEYTSARMVDATVGGTPWPEIMRAMLDRQRGQSVLIKSMIEVQDRYNGDWILPEFAEYGDLAPNLVHDSIEHTAMTAAQMMPMTITPALKPGIDFQRHATIRRKAVHHVIRDSRMPLMLARFYRQLCGYGAGAGIAWPDLKAEKVRVQARDALTAYPEPKDPADFTPPANVGFIYGKTAKWLRANYPDACQEHGGIIPRVTSQSEEMWDCVQWWDEDAMVLGILGPRWRREASREINASGGFEIARVANRSGMCPGMMPWLITLDRVASSISLITGKTDLLARFTALDMIASEKAIFPDRYMVGGGNGMVPRLLNEDGWQDGRYGETNMIIDAAQVGEMRQTPDPSGKIARDYIERNARGTAGLVAPFMGETYGALRTGRGIESLLEASVDPRVHELHQIGEWCIGHLLTASLAMYKGYFGSKTFSLYSGLEGDTITEFKPNIHIDTPEVQVVYPIPGTDVQGTTIILGQLLAAKGMSPSTFRSRHPWIRDDGTEEQKILRQTIYDSVLAGLSERMPMGIHPEDQATLLELADEGKDLAAIIKEANKLAQERQAAEAPAPPEGMAMAPETQMGIGLPGEGGEMQPPPMPPQIEGPNESQANLKSMLLALKQSPPPAVQ